MSNSFLVYYSVLVLFGLSGGQGRQGIMVNRFLARITSSLHISGILAIFTPHMKKEVRTLYMQGSSTVYKLWTVL